MPTFEIASHHAAFITLMNGGPALAEFKLLVQVVGQSDGSPVATSQSASIAPGQTVEFPVSLIMPGSPGTYALGGEVWARPVPGNGDWLRIGVFHSLGDPVVIVPVGVPTPPAPTAPPPVPVGSGGGLGILLVTAVGVGLVALALKKQGQEGG